ILMSLSFSLPTLSSRSSSSLFSSNHSAPPHIYTLSLHDALPISARLARDGVHPVVRGRWAAAGPVGRPGAAELGPGGGRRPVERSEEHTSELQSLTNLVCRLLLEKKKKDSSSSTRRRAADESRVL